jgi:hypothetical protein
MKRLFAVLFLFVLALPLMGDGTQWPRVTAVTPDSAKATVEFTATGDNLSKQDVADVFLNDGSADFRVTIIEQSKDTLKFKLPAGMKAGRYAVVVLTIDRMQFIEQPVKITIE